VAHWGLLRQKQTNSLNEKRVSLKQIGYLPFCVPSRGWNFWNSPCTKKKAVVDWPRGSFLGKVKSPKSTQAHLSLLPIPVPLLAVTDTNKMRYSYMHTLIINVNRSA